MMMMENQTGPLRCVSHADHNPNLTSLLDQEGQGLHHRQTPAHNHRHEEVVMHPSPIVSFSLDACFGK
jgi:hypothetical protein